MIPNTIEGQRKGRKMRARKREIFILAPVIAGALMIWLAAAEISIGQEQSQQGHQQQDQGKQGQQAQQQQDPGKQGSQGQSSGESSSKKTDTAKTPAADEDPHKYDAYNAEKDIEVGTFYMHKGDLDAAIPRFEEAASLRPNYGKPRLLLAEAYEKKKDPESALKYYKEYLKVYPDAPDAKKIQKKIEKMEGK